MKAIHNQLLGECPFWFFVQFCFEVGSETFTSLLGDTFASVVFLAEGINATACLLPFLYEAVSLVLVDTVAVFVFGEEDRKFFVGLLQCIICKNHAILFYLLMIIFLILNCILYDLFLLLHKYYKYKMVQNNCVLLQPGSIDESEDDLFIRVSELIEESRKHIAKAVNTTIVYTYYCVGQYIIEYEQQGDYRASYGKSVLKRLSSRLTVRFGKGWSYETLAKCRKFYHVYSNLSDGQTKFIPEFTLSWNHYQILMRIDNPEERHFYEIESAKQSWGYKWLQRQQASSLYERLAISKDKNEVMRLAKQGQVVEKPMDIIKNPITLEFIGLASEDVYTETRLESAIISRLQVFLLEMGKGFLFEARQKRFAFNEDSYYVDLVLYNRMLQYYVLVDLKTTKLTHQDLGQMQMYVNYYDRYIKLDFEKPTIGILLCKAKDDALVELTLPPNANIYASAYELCLPEKALLQAKLKEWIEEYENGL